MDQEIDDDQCRFLAPDTPEGCSTCSSNSRKAKSDFNSPCSHLCVLLPELLFVFGPIDFNRKRLTWAKQKLVRRSNSISPTPISSPLPSAFYWLHKDAWGFIHTMAFLDHEQNHHDSARNSESLQIAGRLLIPVTFNGTKNRSTIFTWQIAVKIAGHLSPKSRFRTSFGQQASRGFAMILQAKINKNR